MDPIRLLSVGESWALVLVLMAAGAVLITLAAAGLEALEGRQKRRREMDYRKILERRWW